MLPLGHMKSLSGEITQRELEVLLDLQTNVLLDVGDLCDVSLSHDIHTVNQRVRHEGFSFMSKTLPAFGKNFLLSCQLGSFQRDSAFHTRSSRALPEFLIGLTERVFDKKTGLILEEPCYIHAWGIHQITQLLYKYKLPFNWEVEQKSLVQTIKTDQGLPESFNSDEFTLSQNAGFTLQLASDLLESLFVQLDLKEIMPRHGPGATNEGRITGYEKYEFRRFDEALDIFYPMGEYCLASASLLRDQNLDLYQRQKRSRRYLSVCSLRNGTMHTTKIACVPKDSRGPRIISAEPKERLWIQQGQMRAIVRHLESHAWTRGRVNFRDQSVNARLALEGSLSGYWATLDMAEASDRVSLALVHALFPQHVFEPLMASRSSYTWCDFPVSETERKPYRWKLKKFSPMGSAVCFPVLATVMWALTVAALKSECGITVGRAMSVTYVYGDDIIIPAEYAENVMKGIERYGLLFNHSKSFIKGPFRESCGTDAFLGVDITPVRVKQRMPIQRTDVNSLVGWTATANLLKEAGLDRCSKRMFSCVEKILGQLPLAPRNAGLLAHHVPSYISIRDCGWRKAKRVEEFVQWRSGKGFHILRRTPKPDYHGYLKKGWTLKSKRVQPSMREFPETHAYLRHVVEKFHDTAWFESGGDARTFGVTDVVKLEKQWVSFS